VCGRYTLATPAGDILETFDVGPLTFDYFPRYNIAPGQLAPVVAQDHSGRRAGLLTWGLIPQWRDDPGTGLVNARSESVASKPSFCSAFQRRRCLVPADGFYEWSERAGRSASDSGQDEGAGHLKGAGAGKQPYWIHPVEGGLIAFAGLWERWSRPGAEDRNTFTILTTAASADVEPLHHRMPLVVDRADFDAWLDRTTTGAALSALLRPAPEGTFAAHPVARTVNRATEEGPHLVDPVHFVSEETPPTA
jgi:putative SOS response-associated peptidase YedK